MNNNFLVVRLGDNDYGRIIKDAIQHGIDYWGLDNTEELHIWKQFILNYVECYFKQSVLIRFRQNYESPMNYFREKMVVTYEAHAPTDDHDGGSAAYAFDTKYLFTF